MYFATNPINTSVAIIKRNRIVTDQEPINSKTPVVTKIGSSTIIFASVKKVSIRIHGTVTLLLIAPTELFRFMAVLMDITSKIVPDHAPSLRPPKNRPISSGKPFRTGTVFTSTIAFVCTNLDYIRTIRSALFTCVALQEKASS